jgi:hypothetical protein
MDTQQKDLSYFRLRLQELLSTSFPERVHDVKFIDQRSSGLPMLMKMLFGQGTPSANVTILPIIAYLKDCIFPSFTPFFRWSAMSLILSWSMKNYDRLP